MYKRNDKRIAICYFGSYDIKEPRNSTFIAGMKASDMAVYEINSKAIENRSAKEKFASPFRLVKLVLKSLINTLLAFINLRKLPPIDAIVVGYPGYFDLLFAKIFSLFRKVPLLFNVHITLYETLVIDRKFVKRNSILAVLIKYFDRLLFHLSDLVIVDTNSHLEYFARLYHTPGAKFRRVFIGADDVFKPREKQRNNKKFMVLFYGSFIPLQGIEYIVRAAQILSDQKDIQFEIIGKGQTKLSIEKLARKLGVNNIHFTDWVSLKELTQRIGEADVCLGGQFGLTEKADLVIGYKCYQMMAMKKPVILGNTNGNRELFSDKENCLYCNRGDGVSMADAILALKNEPVLRKKIAQNAYQTFMKNCSRQSNGATIKEIVLELIAARRN